MNGVVHRVVRWRTKNGSLTKGAPGPVRLETGAGGTVLVPGLVETVTQTNTATETVTKNVRETVTDIVTVTEKLPAETVTVAITETVGAP